MAEGMRITISPEGGCDSQTVIIRRDGRFEFAGLSSGKYGILPSVRGYALPGNHDADHVSVISDPACEAADCGATIKFSPTSHRPSMRPTPCLPTQASCVNSRLRGLAPDGEWITVCGL